MLAEDYDDVCHVWKATVLILYFESFLRPFSNKFDIFITCLPLAVIFVTSRGVLVKMKLEYL